MKRTPEIDFSQPHGLKVALCQVATEEWNVSQNVERTLESLILAGEKGAHVAVTPECVFTGYPWIDSCEKQEQLIRVSDEIPSPQIDRVVALAEHYQMAVVLGVSVRSGCRLYNSALYISPAGRLERVYEKVHCRAFEDAAYGKHYSAGEEFFVVDFRHDSIHAKLGIMICFDREVPESARCLRALEAEVILCPLACDTSVMADQYYDYADNEIITRVRAAENEVYFVVVNHAEPRFNGGSFVVGPGGELVQQLGPVADVQVVGLPLEPLRVMHEDPFGQNGWGYRKEALYGRYLSPEGRSSLTHSHDS